VLLLLLLLLLLLVVAAGTAVLPVQVQLWWCGVMAACPAPGLRGGWR
jgi:hypothetical protein